MASRDDIRVTRQVSGSTHATLTGSRNDRRVPADAGCRRTHPPLTILPRIAP